MRGAALALIAGAVVGSGCEASDEGPSDLARHDFSPGERLRRDARADAVGPDDAPDLAAERTDSAVDASAAAGDAATRQAAPDAAIPDGSADRGLPDGAAPDLARPAPLARHLGIAGATCCIVPRADRVLYLAQPDPAAHTGALHLASLASDAVLVAARAPRFGYALAPDGKTALYLAPTADPQRFALQWVDAQNPGRPVTSIAAGLDATPLLQQGFFAPSGRYFVAGVHPPNVNVSLDLHVIELATGRDVFSLGDGAFDYLERVNPADVMLYQDTVGGHSPQDPPVQTLLQLSLPAAAMGAAPTRIDIHTADLALTSDGSTLVYGKTGGALYAWDIAGLKGTPIAPSAPRFAVGPQPRGPIAFVAVDGSIHAVDLAGHSLLAGPAGSADLLAPLVFAADGAALLFFTNAEIQRHRGDLYAAALPNGAIHPIARGAALTGARILDGRVFYFANPDPLGGFGDLILAHLDGTNPRVLATGVAISGLAQAPGPVPRLAYLASAALDPQHDPIDGTAAVLGTLSLTPARPSQIAQNGIVLGGSVQAGRFGFSEDGGVLAWAGAAQFDPGAHAFVATLGLRDVVAAVDAPQVLAGVSELGPAMAHGLFVNAPAANPAGVYFVSY